MPRAARSWTSQLCGSVHIISRVAGGEFLFHEEEKEVFMKLIEHFAAGFFIDIHAFAVMGNHFHILATGLELDAEKASKEELLRRYKLLYKKNADPPEGRYARDGSVIYDEDGGIERLRVRLGSVSRFVQELKQTFTRWYNKKHERKGTFWSERYRSTLINKGDAQLACSAYIDLNPVRAGIVERPEDYRWSSIGLRVRNPRRTNKFLKKISIPVREILKKPEQKQSELGNLEKESEITIPWYREFIYVSGNIEKYGNTTAATIPLCLWEWESQLNKGDNIVLAAFGGGFTWGSIYLKWAYDGNENND